ncbi:MAG TPA: putative Ig domain-containing protein, partial [Bryobacteraceae bacterium]|nr:putative Ig domain-containing protein [Bryobacteraceae bacterium]
MKKFSPLLLLAAAVVCQAQPPLTITTSQLPFAQLNLPYNVQLNATGGTPPYTWTEAGGLNPGLSVSPAGVISGTPTGPGDGFSIQVTDSSSQSAFAAFAINFCSGSTNASSQGHTFEDPGGTDVLAVTSTCGVLTPSVSVPWINITGNNGVDTINISVAPNATPATRTGSVTFTYNSTSPVLVLSYTVTQYAKLQFSTPPSLPLGEVGAPYSITLQATGGSGISRSFAITSGSLPAGLGFSGQTISGTPTAPGTSSFTVKVTDLDGFSGAPFSGTQTFTLTVAPPLAITATPLPGAIVGLSYSTPLAATGGIPPISWSIVSGALPTGLVLNPASGVISGTPAPNAQGSYGFMIRASDSAGLVSTVPFQLLVDPPPLVIRTATLSPATEGVAYTATLAAAGGTPPYSWSASGLPSWLTITSAGQLSGTPPVGSAGMGSAGNYSFNINVQDGASRLAGVSFTLLVIPGPLMITTTSPLTRVKEGSQVNVGFQAGGGISPYNWTAAGLPGFLNLSSAGLLSGTPPVGSSGSYRFSVTVTDAAGHSASGMFSLSIDPVLSITTSSSLQATQGQPFSATFTASGGTGPYSFSASELPGWANMSLGGVLNGTPSRGSAGGSTFAVAVSDAAGHIGSGSYTLTVLSPNGGVTITTPSPLPIASVGNYYLAMLVATGGTPPYRWSGSGIPGGLTLSSTGLLSGTPAAAGDDTVTAQVTDSNGNVAFQALSLQVTAANLRIVTPSPLAVAEVSVSYSVAFQSDSAARPLVWSVSGPVPAGLTFDSTGWLTGSPTSPGDFVFTVHVTDATGTTASAPYELLVRPFGPDLLLSAGGLSFAGVRGGAPPPVQTVSAISSTHDSIPFSATADAPWITPAASGTTPGRIDVSVDQTGLAAGTYAGTITVTAPNRPPQF